MAAGVLAPPGTEYGPCEQACEHTDCRATREEAATPCSICQEPIGYGQRFYKADDWHPTVPRLEHASCAEASA